MWPKRGAFLPGPRGPQHPELSPLYISVSFLLDVAKEDAAAQPGELLLRPTHPPRVQSGRRVAEPAGDRRASGFQGRGSWAGGRKSEAEEEGEGSVPHTSEAPGTSLCSPENQLWGVGGVDQSYPPALALGLGPQSWAQEPEKAGVLKAAGFAEVSQALGGGS